MSLIFLRNKVSGAAPAFDPASLFASGEEGAWYEPSPTTCFTDASGLVPATYGDEVQYLEDLSGNGNHATQTTLASRPILARVPSTGRRNLLERTEEFDDAVWTKSSVTVSPDDTLDPNGLLTADKIIESISGPVQHNLRQIAAVSANTLHTASIFVKASDRTRLRFGLLNASLNSGAFAQFNLTTEEISGQTTAGTATNVSYSIEPSTNDWYRCSVTATVDSSSTSITPFIGILDDSGNANYSGDGTSGIYIWGAQLEEGSTATAYQKVVDEYDITEAGVTSLDYLYDDQSDDALPWTAPADTDYTIAYVNTSGTVTTLTAQSLSGATDILLDPAIVGYVAVDRALTAGETTNLQTYLGALA